ncbi:uncharacterized protein LOC113377990 [Ctenocephalides felis]|uniref:uncharacterized protein LOC113377990 n=1 Tax=Ctenocephalides felis TaxID=7515 RepID=UPI000E6E35F4|nr:uncharacterized protein LOC113377990 [Ctenocephalides felis]
MPPKKACGTVAKSKCAGGSCSLLKLKTKSRNYSNSSCDSPKPKKKTSVATNRAASKTSAKAVKTPMKRQTNTKKSILKACPLQKRYGTLKNECSSSSSESSSYSDSYDSYDSYDSSYSDDSPVIKRGAKSACSGSKCSKPAAKPKPKAKPKSSSSKRGCGCGC